MPRGRPRKACGAGKERVGLTCLVKCNTNQTRCKKTNRCRTMKQKGKKKSSTISIVKSILENVIPSSVKKTRRRGRPKASSATSKKQKKDTIEAIKKILLSSPNSSSSSPKKKSSSPIDEDKPFTLNFSFPSVPSLLKKEDVESSSNVVPSLEIIQEASNFYKFDIGREENMFHFKDYEEQKAIIIRLMKEDKEWFEDQQFSQHDLHKLIQAYEYFSLLNLRKYFPTNQINLRALAAFKAGLLPTKYNRWKLV